MTEREGVTWVVKSKLLLTGPFFAEIAAVGIMSIRQLFDGPQAIAWSPLQRFCPRVGTAAANTTKTAQPADRPIEAADESRNSAKEVLQASYWIL